MEQVEPNKSLVKQMVYIISVHTVLLVVYNYTHERIDMYFSFQTYYLILLLLCAVPVITVLMLSTRVARQGAIMLLGILPAEMIYIVYSRFSALPPLARQEPSLVWKILYEGSFGSILLLEAIAFWLSLRLLQEMHKQTKTIKI
jgi:hypothetical protein